MKNNTNENHLSRSHVKALMLQGMGRRRIAETLNTSEYQVRKVIQEIVASGEANHVSAGRPSKPSVSSPTEMRGAGGTTGPIEPKGYTISLDEYTKLVAENERLRLGQVKTNKPTISKSEITKRVAILSDTHHPYQEQKVIDLFIEYCLDTKPETIVLLGDIMDAYMVSSFDKDHRNKHTFAEEVESTVEFLTLLRDTFPDTEIIFQPGNHCYRLYKFLLKNADALLDLPELSIKSLLKLDELNIKYQPGHTPLRIGELLLTHGTMARKGAGSSARGHQEKYQNSICIGHIHRAATGYKRVQGAHQIMIENPCACKMEVDYGTFFDWIQGWTMIYYNEDVCAAFSCVYRNGSVITPEGVYNISTGDN
jgi:metallophosphoesterase superfamily enzyme